MKMVSKPSVSQTAPQVSNRGLHGAVVLLGFFCGFLLVGLIGLGFHYIVSIDKSAAKLSSVCDQISNLTADRDRLNARIINVTKEVEKLKSETKEACPAGWRLLSGRCYFFSNGDASWGVGRSYCRSQGGDLLIINNREEMMTTPTNTAYWIGLSDSEQEGVWKWVDGSALTELFWSLNQPNNGNGDPKYGEQDCAYTYNDMWNDVHCNIRYRFICEKPPILYEQF